MNEYTLSVFGLYYKRIMRVENQLKTLIITRYNNAYGANAYKIIFTQFYAKTEKNKHSRDKIYTNINKLSVANEEKLASSVAKMYLSEITNFLGHPVFLKNKVRHNFFEQQIKTNTTDFQSKMKALNEFRNCVAHIDEKKLNKDLARFTKNLVYFENLLGCKNTINANILNLMSTQNKRTTIDILKIIYQTDKNLFKDDKILISVFDEIAIINGYTLETLPQRWSIIRQKFAIERKDKKNKSTSLNNGQLPLQF